MRNHKSNKKDHIIQRISDKNQHKAQQEQRRTPLVKVKEDCLKDMMRVTYQRRKTLDSISEMWNAHKIRRTEKRSKVDLPFGETSREEEIGGKRNKRLVR